MNNSKNSPGATYDHISKWMTEQALTDIEFPSGIVPAVFDNEQVIGKTHQVRANNKVPSSICTSQLMKQTLYKMTILLHLKLGCIANLMKNNEVRT